MKKTILLGVLALAAVLLPGVAGRAQESRQDVSISGFGVINPSVTGNSVHLDPTISAGILGSYRFLLTPRSALEANYGFSQYTNYYRYGGLNVENPIHTRQQEASLAYVFGLTFKNYNPFAEAGIATVFFSPIKDNGTSQLDAKRNTNIGGLFGLGMAYEISPSFDIRAEYRGTIIKAPDFKLPNDLFKTGRYELMSSPSIGVAYHF